MLPHFHACTLAGSRLCYRRYYAHRDRLMASPENVVSGLGLASAALSRGDLVSAEAVCRGVATQAPGEFRARLLLIKIVWRRMTLKRTASLLTVAQDPHNFKALYRLALAQRALGKYEEASAAASFAVQENSSDAAAWIVLGITNTSRRWNTKRLVSAAALVLSGATLALATYQSGYDVGWACLGDNPNPSLGWFNGCCAGGCSSFHTNPSQGYTSCMNKCISCYPSGCPV